MKKIMITGGDGQLGFELQRTAPVGYTLDVFDVDSLDICNETAVQSMVKDLRPDVLINCAAYTAVDKAEEEMAKAFAVNEKGAGNLAGACRLTDTRMIHISTDFVFRGNASTPYKADDRIDPISIYGASKAAGERAVLEGTKGEALIIRTSWLYSSHGGNFVKTMLNLMRTRKQLAVVSDQVGTPTWAKNLAEAIWSAAEKPEIKGIYHWSDFGVASWYDFAVAIQDEALALGLLSEPITILPIPTRDYPTPAQRPAFSVMDKSTAVRDFHLPPVHWNHALKGMMQELQ